MVGNYSKKTLKDLLTLQKGEMTGYIVYKKLAKRTKDVHNKEILNTIANEELKHYNIFKNYTNKDVSASRVRVVFYTLLSSILGLTFGVKLMEQGEAKTVKIYGLIVDEIPEIESIIKEEEEHEKLLINMIDEEGLTYMSSVVLGLNDALVELTGALAGFTLSIQNSKTIALIGLITGISASLSMAASEYLATKADEEDGSESTKNALKASIYTGSAYVVTVVFLILPFFLFSNYIISLAISISVAILIIAIFNYYISVAKDYNFKKRFFGMASISISVALVSFFIGYLVNTFIGIDL